MADVVRVRVGDRQWAVPTVRVREVAVVGSLTPVPHAPPAILGLMQLRGQILPVIELGPDGAAAHPPKPGDPLLVVESGPIRAALRVDHVHGVEPDTGRVEVLDVATLFDRLRLSTTPTVSR
jgi:purine-binding chemotaxis protein CheW